MKKLLLLHERHTPDDSDIWRVAVRRGWKTERTNMYKVKGHMEGHDYIRYYGNTLHAKLLEDLLPFKFLPINYWALASLRQFTKRSIYYIPYANLFQPVKDTMFIKPARDKWFEARVYEAGETISGSPLEGDEIYVSEVVKFTDEVRCFVRDGEILTSSLYRINSFVWDQTNEKPEDINFDSRIRDTDIPRAVKAIHSLAALPSGVVIDFGRLPNGDWALIEFNEAWASGLYYCDPEKCLDVIEASQESFKI